MLFRSVEGKDSATLIDFWHDWDKEYNDLGKIVDGPVLRDDVSRDKVYESLGFSRTWVEDINQIVL